MAPGEEKFNVTDISGTALGYPRMGLDQQEKWAQWCKRAPLTRLGAGALCVLLEDYMGWVGSVLSSSAESLSLIGTAYQILQE